MNVTFDRGHDDSVLYHGTENDSVVDFSFEKFGDTSNARNVSFG